MKFRKQDEELLDLRSQGRKRARAVLLQQVEDGLIPFACNFNVPTIGNKCGWYPVGELTRSNNLDANHINKNLADVDPANLEWLCRKHHKLIDSQTEKGVSIKEDEFGYQI